MRKITETKARIKKQAASLEKKLNMSEFEFSLHNEEMDDAYEEELKAAMEIQDEEKKAEMIRLIKLIDERKRLYGILDTKLQAHQLPVLDEIAERQKRGWHSFPRWRTMLFQWGNGAWKTFVLTYIIVLLALWEDCKKYWLPYIGAKKNIWLATKSGANVKGTFQPYLLWDYSKVRIPPDAIKKIRQDNGILKEIILNNGCSISIRTYDQGRENLQWGNPDFLWIDEEPTWEGVWNELLARIRLPQSQMFIAMTPLSWHTPVYEYFYNTDVEGMDTRKKWLVSSLENKEADHSALMMLPEHERKMRIYGQFVPPSWLVYASFYPDKHTVDHFHPRLLWEGIRYYWWIDFWVSHATGFILIAVDLDDNMYIFDGFKKERMFLDEMADEIIGLVKKYGIELEYLVGDTAWKRERLELNKLFKQKKSELKIIPADKHSKGENGTSNRKASILKVNTLLHNGKLFISKELKPLINELMKHHYKENGSDGDVIKLDDDIIDAMRYCIWSIKPAKAITKEQQAFEKKYNEKYKKNWLYKQIYSNVY